MLVFDIFSVFIYDMLLNINFLLCKLCFYLFNIIDYFIFNEMNVSCLDIIELKVN